MITTIETSQHEALMIKTQINAWQNQVNKINELLLLLSDEKLMREIAPGRNRGVYILGHLVAVNDNIFPLLNLGKKLHPQLEEIFISNPDKKVTELPSISLLKSNWNNVNENLLSSFNSLTPGQWLSRHMNISDEAFIKENHRNKLNILITRTNHLSYHLGQLTLLKNAESVL